MDFEELINTLNFSGIAWQIATPLIFAGVDFLVGYLQAVINKEVSVEKMRTGLIHKFLEIIIVLLSFVIHITFNLPFISKSVCIYIIIMEVMSILENLNKAGLNLGKLTEIIEDTKEEK